MNEDAFSGLGRRDDVYRFLRYQLHQLFARQWLAEEITLNLIASKKSQQSQLFLCLDAFGNHFQSEVLSKRHDRWAAICERLRRNLDDLIQPDLPRASFIS